MLQPGPSHLPPGGCKHRGPDEPVGEELNAQCQSEHSAPGPTAGTAARLTHSLNRRLWILGQASTSFWGSAPSWSSDLLSATEAQDTNSSVPPGVLEKEVTAWPLQGSTHRLQGLRQGMLNSGSVARAARLGGTHPPHPDTATECHSRQRSDGNGLGNQKNRATLCTA